MINVFEPSAGAEELEAVRQVFATNWLGEGGLTRRFEHEWAEHLGVLPSSVQAIATCTEGLYAAMHALQIGPGDDVVLPSIHFVGAANAICSAGAQPVFCDVDERTLNVGVEDVIRALTHRTRAVLVLHYGGVPCDIEAIADLCRAQKIDLIEDCACSPASAVNGKMVGTFGSYAVWSFDAMKIMTCGDGAMVYCPDPDNLHRLRNHIYLGQDSFMGSRRTGRWWEIEVEDYGRRAAMNDVQSAIGLMQLKKLGFLINRRKQFYDRYYHNLYEQDWLSLPLPTTPIVQNSYYFFWVQTLAEARDRLAVYLREREVYTTFRYWPLHRIKLYDHYGGLPGADYAAFTTLLLPLHANLDEDTIDRISELVIGFGETEL